MKKIKIPKVDINTEKVLINKWFVKPFDFVEKETVIAVIETSKTALDILAPSSGYFFSDSEVGEFVPIVKPLGCIFATIEECKKHCRQIRFP